VSSEKTDKIEIIVDKIKGNNNSEEEEDLRRRTAIMIIATTAAVLVAAMMTSHHQGGGVDHHHRSMEIILILLHMIVTVHLHQYITTIHHHPICIIIINCIHINRHRISMIGSITEGVHLHRVVVAPAVAAIWVDTEIKLEEVEATEDGVEVPHCHREIVIETIREEEDRMAVAV
jgi:hypothetical protein